MRDVISFIGFSKSGKTAIVSQLVSYFTKKGYKVGVIKHTTKDFQIDKEGKDSWRIFNAGGDVAVLSPVKMALQIHLNRKLSLDELSDFFSGYDIIMTEGFKKEFKKAIVVARNREELDELLEQIKKERGSKDGILAAVLDNNANLDIPVFHPDQIEELAKFILSIRKSQS